MKLLLRRYFVFTLLFLSGAGLYAQSLLYDRTPNSINVQWLRPSIPGGNTEIAFGTSRSSITGRFTVGQDKAIIVEVPFAYYKLKTFNNSEIGLGNIYLGMELPFDNKQTFAELGVALPTRGTNSSIFIGYLSDFDRLQTFGFEATTLKFRLNYAELNEEGFIYRFRVGPDYFIFSNELNDGSELWLNYAIQLGFRGSSFYGLAGVSAFTILTESSLSRAARSQYSFSAMLVLSKHRIKPGIVFKVPIDNDFDGLVNNVLGLCVNFEL